VWTSEGDFPWPYADARLKLHGFGEQEVNLRKRG